MTKIAIIGTAGRDKTKPMTKALWNWMIEDAMARVPKLSHVVSGGAAWADHLAVYLFLSGHAAKLTLHMPAPFTDGEFVGPAQSAASAANWYHHLFSQALDHDTRNDFIRAVSLRGCDGTEEPASPGYGAMFRRNKKVALDAGAGVIAYTFGEGDVPADGGTKNTWDLCSCRDKTHVTLPILR